MTTQATHTPGPWRFEPVGKYYTVRGSQSPHKSQVCRVTPGICACANGHQHGEANARLIAAAPEMLEALRVTLHRAEQARHSSEQPGPILAEWLDGIIAEARAAIAKAEGRAE